MFEFLLQPGNPANIWIILVLAGLVTYITRSMGYLVIARFKTLNPRVESALEAVPSAVLATLVFPMALTNGPLELLAMIAAMITSLKLPPLVVLGTGLAIVVLGRSLGF